MYLFNCYVHTPLSLVAQYHGIYANTAAEARAKIREAATKQQIKILKIKVVKFG